MKQLIFIMSCCFLFCSEKHGENINTNTETNRLYTTQSSAKTSFIKFGLSGLFSFADTNVSDDVLQTLAAGGHDPNKNGFSVQKC